MFNTKNNNFELDDLTENLDKETIAEINSGAIIMEYVGIKLVDAKTKHEYGDNPVDRLVPKFLIQYYFTVPESSTLDKPIHDIDFDKVDLKTSEGLINYGKEAIKHLVLAYTKNQRKDMDTEEAEEYKNFLIDSLRFYAKVRKGDIWDNEKAKTAISKILNEMKENSGFKEV